MTTHTQVSRIPRGSSDAAAATSRTHTARVSGDELFVPASHGLITDRHVSHPAFRLWCVLHRLWFLHEPPAMDLLQDLMGTPVTAQRATSASGSRDTPWQPATRRSIERWLTELERAGWLLWTRRAETTHRYHLRTSARSATDTAMLATLRTLLNSGKATLSDVQVLLNTISSLDTAASAPSHQSINRSQHGAVTGPALQHGATTGSHTTTNRPSDATITSHDTISRSPTATTGADGTSPESYHPFGESRDTSPQSPVIPTVGVLVRQSSAQYSETLQQHENHIEPTPPSTMCPASDDGGGGPTSVERYLLQQGFSTRAAHEFRAFDLSVVQSDLERRRNVGQGIGAIVTTWRVEPPHAARPDRDEGVTIACQATNAKTQALAIAPPDASALEMQYLALDLEEGVPSETALAHLWARRTDALAGGRV